MLNQKKIKAFRMTRHASLRAMAALFVASLLRVEMRHNDSLTDVISCSSGISACEPGGQRQLIHIPQLIMVRTSAIIA